jgi:hypothetical protein
MKTFKQFLLEGKKVGVIFHFTSFENLGLMLENDKFILKPGRNGLISFTRNPSMPRQSHFFDDSADVRIAFSGSSLSDKYKITPLNGLTVDNKNVYSSKNDVFRVGRNENEAEEIILAKQSFLDLTKYILRVDISTRDARKELKIKEYKNKLDFLNIEMKRSMTSFPSVHGLKEEFDWNSDWVNESVFVLEKKREQ